MRNTTPSADSVSLLPFLLGSTLSVLLAAFLAAGAGAEPYPVAGPSLAAQE